MLTHHALKLLKRRTGLTNARQVKLIEHWYETAVRRLRKESAARRAADFLCAAK